MTISKIMQDFKNGKTKGKSGSVFIEDNVIYSYGKHFPMGIRLKINENKFYFLINKSKYSKTTSKQTTFLKRELGIEHTDEKTTDELKDIIQTGLKSVNKLILKQLITRGLQ